MAFSSYCKVKFRKHKFLVFVSLFIVFIFYFTYQNSQHLALRQKLQQSPIVVDDSQIGTVGGLDENVSEPQKVDPIPEPERLGLNKQLPMLNVDDGKSRDDDGYTPLKKPSVSLPRQFVFKTDETNMYSLPTVDYSEKRYKQVQSDVFEENHGVADREKLDKIKLAFMKSWTNYRKYAIDHDEILPLTNKGKDPFVGWSITLLDTLDTLHLMGLTEEFQFAVDKVAKINFRRSPREYIPVFETVIRALGGLISAYDVSGEKILLDKSIECGDMLIGIFDTPNNMPLLYYRWAEEDAARPKFASKSGSTAEFGTLLLEYTRLAQITGNNTYFHYVQKITNQVEEFIAREKELASHFKLNGLLPTHMDISGCEIVRDEKAAKEEAERKKETPKFIEALFNSAPALCRLTGIHPLYSPTQVYTLGGLADSYYEYLIKQYHLLNGSVKQYLSLFNIASTKIKQYLFFKAKLPSILVTESNTVPHLKTDPDDVVFLSELQSYQGGRTDIKQKTWITHLSCFAGGMFGLASRVNSANEKEAEENLKVAKQITNGCYKIYELMELMPEWLIVERCPEGTTEDDPECQFDIKDRIKKIRVATEDKSAKDFKTDADLLKGIAFNTPDSKDSKMQEEEDMEGEAINYSKVEKHLNVNKQNFAHFANAIGSANFDKTKVKKFPPKSKPSFEVKFETTNSDIPREQLLRTTKGDIHWPVNHNYDIPLWTNNIAGKFILRPELIESVFYMYRITGDLEWREKGWKLFENTIKHTSFKDGFAALKDVSHLYLSSGTLNKDNKKNSLESFWFAETLKYYYLLFEDKDVWSLDEYVFNTEAHPFKRDMKTLA